MVAVVLSALVLSLRALVSDPSAAVLVLLCLPVALVAVAFGRWAGLAAAGTAVGLVALSHTIVGEPMDPLGYLTRGIAFGLLGLGLGWFADQAVAAQQRTERVVDSLLEAVAVGTAIRDRQGRISDFRVDYANPVAVRMWRRAPDEVRGRRWSECWPMAFQGELFPAFAHTVETGTPIRRTDYAVQVERRDVAVPALLDLRVTRLDDGVVVAWREVSARRRANELVAAAHAQFASAFDHAPLGMVLLDEDHRIVQVNAAFCAIVGYQPEQLIGVSANILSDPQDMLAGRHGFARHTRGDEPPHRLEQRLLTAGGDIRWASVSVARVHGAQGVQTVVHVEDITDRRSYEGRLRFLADHDPLTGLYNRRRFHEELSHQMTLDGRYRTTSAVVLLDLDNFKYINDTLGHQTGDRLIQTIAHVLRLRLRDSDVIGRLGGDEFAVLLTGADATDAMTVTRMLLDAIRASTLRHEGQRVRSTGSAGIAVHTDAGTDADELLASADLAMYAAKEAGRDTCVVYHPQASYAEQSRARFRWLDRIRNALEHELFALQAQPILDLSTGEVTGSELLLRMLDDGRLIPPGSFLQIAERHGLANPIDRYVISHAIRLAAANPRPDGFRWEINLSADSLRDPTIVDLVHTELAATDLPPSALVFEITETAAITSLDEAQAFAAQIGEIGCRFALDDFGAGYGSFYYLKHLPFEYLKIDGEFIRQCTTNDTDRVIVQAIVAAARQLGKQTVAEYVGDADTLELVRRLHVDHAQGYHIGRPVDPRGQPVSRPYTASLGRRTS